MGRMHPVSLRKIEIDVVMICDASRFLNEILSIFIAFRVTPNHPASSYWPMFFLQMAKFQISSRSGVPPLRFTAW